MEPVGFPKLRKSWEQSVRKNNIADPRQEQPKAGPAKN